MTDRHYPLTDKDFNLATIFDDREAEQRARVAAGLALDDDLEYCFEQLASRAREAVAERHDDTRAEVERHIAAVGAALDSLRDTRVTTTEAARITGYDDSHIRRLVLDGKLAAVKAGRAHLIPRSALAALPPRGNAGRPRKGA